ncbi:MAG: nitroreductase family protein, partial [Lachnospiraceae bacterium]|nr:nitroreductase family protein [Lachnospiraceae bacterium]
MTAKECIKGRRSIRRFKDQPIDHALLSEIIETASYAPSWKHTQITRYIAVSGELKNKIADECTSAYPRNGEIIAQAPMLIVVTYIKGRSGFERDGSYSTVKEGSWQMFDAGVASQSFCLAAYEQG